MRLGSRIVGALAALAVLVGPVVLAGPASAHAVLVRSTPTDGAVLATAPADVELTFDETVELVRGGSRVVADTGEQVLDGSPTTRDGRTVVLPLRPGLPRGAYTASWRVISADGHVVSGSLRFGVGVRPGGATSSSASDSTSRGPGIADGVARAFTYVGAVLMVGVPLAGLLLWPETLTRRRTRRIQGSGTGLLLLGTVLDLLLRGPLATGAGAIGVLRLDGLGDIVTTHDGVLLLLRSGAVLVLGGLLVVLRPASRVRDGVIVAAWVLVALSLGWTGHASVGPAWGYGVALATAHVAAITLWLGGLVLLLAVVLRDPPVDTAPLRRWSATAVAAVGVIVVTGVLQGVRQVQPVAGLWSTGYGQILLLKTLLVVLVLGAALLARRHIRREPASPGHPSAALARGVRRSVRLELVLLLGVMGLTSALVSTQPARETYGPGTTLEAALPSGRLEIRVASTRRGPQRIEVTAYDAAGRRLALQALDGSLAGAGVAGLTAHFHEGADGRWTSRDAVAPLPGTWTLTLSAQPPGALAYVTATTYRVW